MIPGLLDALERHACAVIEAIGVDGTVATRTFAEFRGDVLALVDRLRRHGPGPRRFVGLHGPNCYEYLVWDIALLAAGAVPVALSDAHLEDPDRELIAGFGLSMLVRADAGGDAVELRLPEMPDKPLTVHDGPAADDDDLMTRVFSSGTSGYLKGLNISTKGTAALVEEFVRDFALRAGDRHVIFLPLTNFQQRMVFQMCLAHGISVKLTTIDQVFRACASFHPSFLIGPPAIFEGLAGLARAGGEPRAVLARTLGPHFRFGICGMAPVSADMLRRFEQWGCRIHEVYGVVECGMISWNRPGRSKIGTVGQMIPGVRVAFDTDDEIVVHKAAPLATGYFSARDDDSANTFRADGAIATGDAGYLDEDGYLVLRGRIKNVIVTPGGQKLHPEQIEQQLFEAEDGRIRDIAVVVGADGRTLYAVVVPAKAADDSQRQALASDLMDRSRRLPVHHRIAQIRLAAGAFSVEDGTLTRNMKKDRRRIREVYCA